MTGSAAAAAEREKAKAAAEKANDAALAAAMAAPDRFNQGLLSAGGRALLHAAAHSLRAADRTADYQRVRDWILDLRPAWRAAVRGLPRNGRGPWNIELRLPTNTWPRLRRIRAHRDGRSVLALLHERLPREVGAQRPHAGRLILPVVRVTTHPETDRGRVLALLPGSPAVAPLPGGTLPGGTLPLFDLHPNAPRVTLLEVADASGRPVLTRGRGAPVDLRLMIRAILSVSPSDWTHLGGAEIALPVGALLDSIWPRHGRRRGWRWDREGALLYAALERLDRYWIPDGLTADGRPVAARWPVRLRRLPLVRDVHEMVELCVGLPRGTRSGPALETARLDALGRESGARYRAFIAAQSLAWRPGRTRVPGRRGGPLRLWSRDIARYPLLTAADRRRLAFGDAAGIGRYRAGVDGAWRNLPGLVTFEREADPESGARGWRIVPAEAVQTDRDGTP